MEDFVLFDDEKYTVQKDKIRVISNMISHDRDFKNVE